MYPVLFNLPEWVPLLGGEPVTSFGVMMVLSFLTAGCVLKAEMRRMDLDADRAWDLLFMAVLGGILGAKIYYILLNYPQFTADPVGMILARGGAVWYGGFLLASALVIWKARQLDLPFGRIIDASAPALALAYAVGRFGCFLVGDDYGRPTGSWIGIAFPNGTPPTRVDALERSFGITVEPGLIEEYGQIVPVHPTQLYEIAFSLMFFVFLWSMRKHKHASGWLFSVWLTLASASRFSVEFFRVKDDRFFEVFTLAQMISMILVGVGVYGIMRLFQPETQPDSQRQTRVDR